MATNVYGYNIEIDANSEFLALIIALCIVVLNLRVTSLLRGQLAMSENIFVFCFVLFFCF